MAMLLPEARIDCAAKNIWQVEGIAAGTCSRKITDGTISINLPTCLTCSTKHLHANRKTLVLHLRVEASMS